MSIRTHVHNPFSVFASLLGRFALGLSFVTVPVAAVDAFSLLSGRSGLANTGLPAALAGVGVLLSLAGLAITASRRCSRACVFGLILNAIAWLMCALSVWLIPR